VIYTASKRFAAMPYYANRIFPVANIFRDLLYNRRRHLQRFAPISEIAIAAIDIAEGSRLQDHPVEWYY
jgi:hypothetical protein